MKSILIILAIVAAALLAVAFGALVIVFVATGVGALLASWLPFSAFEATLLALIAAIGVALVMGQIVVNILRLSSLATESDNQEVEEDEWGDEWEDDEELGEDDEEDIGETSGFSPSIPRWRQPIRLAKSEQVGRNDPCPCGSGKKYKNCHGRAGATT